uniref:Uncharacterized protein n=1 Tax=Monopterus albus TaxID=43700 RepID=A0A3Q3JEN6_MONAL
MFLCMARYCGSGNSGHLRLRGSLEVVHQAVLSIGQSWNFKAVGKRPGFRGQHHIQLCFVRAPTFIPGVESQSQRVVITQGDFLPVPENPTKEKWITNRVSGHIKLC